MIFQKDSFAEDLPSFFFFGPPPRPLNPYNLTHIVERHIKINPS